MSDHPPVLARDPQQPPQEHADIGRGATHHGTPEQCGCHERARVRAALSVDAAPATTTGGSDK